MRWHARTATSEDIDRLALVGAATFLETFAGLLNGAAILAHCAREHSASAYSRYLQSGSAAWLAEAAEGAAPVGFALLGGTDLPGSSAGDLELKRIYTLSRFHGTGAGGALMKLAVDEARRRKARRLLLGVYAHNERARAFYAKHGFEPFARRRFRVGEQEYDDIVLAKPLGT